jgi:hypothetical protein
VFDEHSIGLFSSLVAIVKKFSTSSTIPLGLFHDDEAIGPQPLEFVIKRWMHHVKYKLIYQATNEWIPFWTSKECQRTNHASTTTSSKDSYSNPCPNTYF